jgi:hypothetical protein
LGQGYAVFDFVGNVDWIGNTKKCSRETKDTVQRNIDKGQMSYVSITDNAATCMVEQFFNSPLGHLNLNEKSMNQLFNVTDIKFDTTSYSKYLPLF